MGLLLWCSHCKAWDCPLSVAAKYCWQTTQSQFICWVFVRFTFEKLLLTDAMRVGLRRGWKGGVGRLTARRRRLRRLWVQQRQQGAAIVPAGVVGEVGANETISEGQLLIYGHTRHLHNHPAVIPAVDWWRWCETKRETAWWHTHTQKKFGISTVLVVPLFHYSQLRSSRLRQRSHRLSSLAQSGRGKRAETQPRWCQLP